MKARSEHDNLLAREIFCIKNKWYDINQLIEEGLVNSKTVRGFTPLECIVKAQASLKLTCTQKLNMVKILLSFGADSTDYAYNCADDKMRELLDYANNTNSLISLDGEGINKLTTDIPFIADRLCNLIKQKGLLNGLNLRRYKEQLSFYQLDNEILERIDSLTQEINDCLIIEMERPDLDLNRIKHFLTLIGSDLPNDIFNKILHTENNSLLALALKLNVNIPGNLNPEMVTSQQWELINSAKLADNMKSLPSDCNLSKEERELFDARFISKLFHKNVLVNVKKSIGYDENYIKGVENKIFKLISKIIDKHIENDNVEALEYWENRGYPLSINLEHFINKIFSGDRAKTSVYCIEFLGKEDQAVAEYFHSVLKYEAINCLEEFMWARGENNIWQLELDAHGNTLMHLAAKENKPSIIKWLIEKKVAINILNNQEEYPVTLALDNKNYEVAKIFIDNKANLKCPKYKTLCDQYENTPLHIAVLTGADKFLKECLKDKTIFAQEINYFNKDMLTPLLIAINDQKVEMVESILNFGQWTYYLGYYTYFTDINRADRELYTPLMKAIEVKNAKIINMLVERGALTVKNDLAFYKHCQKVIEAVKADEPIEEILNNFPPCQNGEWFIEVFGDVPKY